MQIRGSDYKEEFKLLQFHFHWGENMYQGSEHYLNYEKYPLEVDRISQISLSIKNYINLI